MDLFNGTSVVNEIASSTNAFLPHVYPILFLAVGIPFGFIVVGFVLRLFGWNSAIDEADIEAQDAIRESQNLIDASYIMEEDITDRDIERGWYDK